MKKILLLTVSILLVSSAFAQSNKIKLNKSAFSPRYILPKGETLYVNGKPIVVDEQLNMLVVEQVGDSLNVIILDEADNDITALDGSDHTTSLYVGTGAHLHIKYRDWDTSPLVIPIKIRPSTAGAPLEFVGEFTLGSYIGYQLGSRSLLDDNKSNYSQTFSLFAAPTMIRINPEVADTDKSNLILGFSTGLGYIVNLNAFQIGLVGGVDYISGDASKTWIYQGKSWFSFTIGFDFNDEESN